MRRTVFLLCLPVCSLSLWLACAPGSVVEVKADDKKPSTKEAAKPPLIDAGDIADAKRTLDALSDQEYAAVCAAHYLVQPSIEEGLFKGRARAICPLEPLEKSSHEDLSASEMLRLWALIDAGLPDSEALQKTIARLLRTSGKRVDNKLARAGVHMLAIKAALSRLPEAKTDNHLGVARALVNAAERTDLCNEKSDWYTEQGIGIEWYANQFWRAVINRCALDLGLKVNFRRWGTDLALLESTFVEGEGWTSRKNKKASTYEFDRQNEDLHTNLLAMAALGLASGTGIEFNREDRAAVELCAARAPRVLAKLIEEFEDLPLNGARLLLALAGKIAPAERDSIAWRDALLAAHRKQFRAEGLGDAYSGVPACLGLKDGEDKSLEEIAAITLGMVAMNGGLFRPQAGPFASRTLGDVGRLFWARTIKEASEAPDLSALVNHKLPNPEPISEFMEKGLKYLATTQLESGGWGVAGFAQKGKPAVVEADPASTAFCALALMRAGSTPHNGTHKQQVLRALEYMLDVVETASDDGPKITTQTNTQPQYKLGPLIDTSMAAQFLARSLVHLTGYAALQSRTEKALEKCLRKIEKSQDADGTWNSAGGWAPVLQSAMMNQALELAELCGRKPDKTVLEKSRGYYRDDENKTEVGKGRGAGVGVSLYAGSATQRTAAKDAREAQDGIMVAIQFGKLGKGATVSEDTLVRAGFTRPQAKTKARAFAKFEEYNKKLEDPAYLKGFGNNGGEEFISFMLCSESLVITGGENWKKWNAQMHETYKGIQNADGSWNGHHCITSPVVCTAATLLCLMADREMHVVIEPSPLIRNTSTPNLPPPMTEPPKEGPITGE